MDGVHLQFLCEASRTVERFGLLGGKPSLSSHHILVKILNLNSSARQNSDSCLHVFVISWSLVSKLVSVPYEDEKSLLLKNVITIQ